MKYNNIVRGRFVSRPNRFIAEVEIGPEETESGEERREQREARPVRLESVHVKNTGRCRELLIPGAQVILEKSDNPSRKTRYDLVAVYKEKTEESETKEENRTENSALLVNIDSQAPNKVAAEWLKDRNFDVIRPEYRFGDSRIDFYMEKDGKQFLMEVKGCTLEIGGIGYFPDAPTERGVRHLRELERAAKLGYVCFAAFVIQMEGVDEVRPNRKMHPEFGEALDQAAKAGVKILFLGCRVREDEISIDRVSGSDFTEASDPGAGSGM